MLIGHAWAANPTVVYLLDAGPTSTEGWTTISKPGSYPAFLQEDTTYNSMYVTSTGAGNFFNTYLAPSRGFAEGSYLALNGTTYSSVLEEMANSLGLESIPASVYSDNLTNGGTTGHIITVNGLDADKTYVMYYIGGANKPSQTVAGFTLKSDGYSGIPKVEYVCTSGNSSHNTSTVTEYTSVPVTTAMRAAADGYLLVRVSYIQPTTSGTISFTLNGERANICALAIAEIDPLAAVTRDLKSTEEIWGAEGNWSTGTVPGADDNVKLNVISETGSKLTLDVEASVKDLTISGDCAVTFAGSGSLSAQNTILKADTDISGITASLGATTIAEGKTLTVGALNPATSIAGVGAVKITADSTWDNGRDSGIKNLYIDNCTLTSTYVSGGSGIASGRTITVDGDSAVLFVNVGDGTGYSNGLDSLIAAKNGGKILFGSRDTLKTAVELTGGTVEIAAEAGNNNRAIDLFNSNDTVADFTVLAAEDATAENPTVSYITPLGTGIHRAIHLRGGNVEFNVAENAVLEISGYLVDNAGGGSAVSMKKTGVGLMTLCGSDASSCTKPIAVEGGTLKVIAPASLGTGAVTVADGATIAGSGTIGGTLTLVAGSTVDATDGTLTVNGDVTLPGEGEVTVKVAETAEAGDTVLTCANAASLDLTKFAAPAGLKCVADGTAVKLAAATPVSTNVAKIGDMEYETLQLAVDDAGENATVELLADTTENITVPAGFNGTIDLGDNTLTGNVKAAYSAATTTDFILQNGYIITPAGNTDKGAIFVKYATVELINIDLTANYHGIRTEVGGNVTINGGRYEAICKKNYQYNVVYAKGNSTITVKGGTFIPTPNEGTVYLCTAYDTGSTINIEGGNLSAGSSTLVVNKSYSGIYTISGGLFAINAKEVVDEKLVEGYLADTTINPGYYTVAKAYNVAKTIDTTKVTVAGLKDAYACGGKASFTVTAVEGNTVTGVTLDGAALTADEDGNYSFTMPEKDVAIVVTTESTSTFDVMIGGSTFANADELKGAAKAGTEMTVPETSTWTADGNVLKKDGEAYVTFADYYTVVVNGTSVTLKLNKPVIGDSAEGADDAFTVSATEVAIKISNYNSDLKYGVRIAADINGLGSAAITPVEPNDGVITLEKATGNSAFYEVVVSDVEIPTKPAE